MHLVAYSFTERLSKDGFRYMERASETFSCPCLLIYRLFDKRAVPLGETHADVITSLMVNSRRFSTFLLTGLRIYTGEYKAQGPTLLRGPRALDSSV